MRLLLESYDSVLTMAFTGVGSAKRGIGPFTVHSVFHTNRADSVEDLIRYELDNLVCELQSVELLVIGEVSTCGAAPLEVVSRRMQQVACVLWRRRFRCPPPDDLGPFGGIDARLIGDLVKFAHAEYELDGRDAPHRERRSIASQALPARVMRLFVVRRAIAMAAVKPGKRTSSATCTKRRTYASERA